MLLSQYWLSESILTKDAPDLTMAIISLKVGSSSLRMLYFHEQTYRQTSNISRTLVGNNFFDYSDVVGASPVGATRTISSFSASLMTYVGKDSCKTRRETFKFQDLVCLY